MRCGCGAVAFIFSIYMYLKPVLYVCWSQCSFQLCTCMFNCVWTVIGWIIGNTYFTARRSQINKIGQLSMTNITALWLDAFWLHLGKRVSTQFKSNLVKPTHFNSPTLSTRTLRSGRKVFCFSLFNSFVAKLKMSFGTTFVFSSKRVFTKQIMKISQLCL